MESNVDECIKNCVDILKDYFNHKDCKCVTEYKTQKQTSKMTHKIEVPEGCKATVSKENGCLVIEVEQEFKQGDVLTVNYGSGNWMFIPVDYNCINNSAFSYVVAYPSFTDELFFGAQISNYSEMQIKKATKEEAELLHSKLAEAGYKYNPETHKLDKVMWKPKVGDVYYTPFWNEENLSWNNNSFENGWHSLGLIFKTKAESDEAAEKIKQIFTK